MNVLLLNIDWMLVDELREWRNGTRITPYIANSRAEALNILSTHSIDTVLFALRTLADLELLNYLNTSYQQIEVILTVGENLYEIVHILKHGKYQVLNTPFKLSELKACFST